jgi:hypothetical protein
MARNRAEKSARKCLYYSYLFEGKYLLLPKRRIKENKKE